MKSNEKKYSDKLDESNKKFEAIIKEHIDAYTKLVEYNLVLSLGSYNEEVIHYSVRVETGEVDWGDYADGEFGDDQLATRELIEEVVCGIETIGHSQYYTWLPMFKEEVSRFDQYLKPIIESYTRHYAKIDAIHLPPEYLEWFVKPFWWRQYEFEVYNEVKETQKNELK